MPAKVKKSILNLKESVRHKHEDSKVNYSVRECCFNRLTQTAERGLQEGSTLRFYFRKI